MVGLPWEQHITFLDNASRRKDIIKRVREAAISCDQHPAILCYAIGNEIPAPIVRWHGKKKVERFLKDLYKAVKEVDPAGLVTYVNYPTTEYLDLSFLDFDCFNVYLETPEKLSAYIARLHNLAGDRPLVLAEIGLDSMRNGLEQQAEVLSWQITTVFAKGCAGMFVFAWTDEWWRGGFDIEDWDFGIVDRARNAKPALKAVSEAMAAVPLKDEPDLPLISVVVCSYNGSATIRDTMEGLMRLDYPSYEVIVVNDGSKDNLADIVKEYPVKLISTPNRGLSSARNTGMREAHGEIVAYIDDDAYPDPHWLRYLAYAYANSNHGGMGGPNIAPPEDGPIGTCVANAPGGPVHVLLSDEIAEHIPGCNMSFRRSALLEVGGCDPIYRAAGDDVDLCWRIQEKGYTIGFHPSAVVWHHRRNSINAYWRQQKGYGKAEALLEGKWPEKYNGFGHITWGGRIYGNGFTLPIKWKKDHVFHGTWGTALFQSVYQRADSFWAALPLMPEWYLFTALLGIIGLLGIFWNPLLWAWLPFWISIGIVVTQAVISASLNVSLPADKKRNPKYRLLITYLHLIQPAARLYGRINHGLTPWRKRGAGASISYLFNFGPRTMTHWSESWRSSEDWLGDIERELVRLKLAVKKGGSFNRWDLQVNSGLFARNRSLLTIEEHGGGKQQLRLKCWPVYATHSFGLFIVLAGLAALAALDRQWIMAAAFTAMAFTIVGKIIIDASNAMNSLDTAFRKLPDGLESPKQPQRIYKENDPALAYDLHNYIPDEVPELEIKPEHTISQQQRQAAVLNN
jgi:glycosyltransferase involved in cell wall biosynthesis